MAHFKKGLFLGGLLGAGVMWLSATKRGKEVRDQMLDHAADVYGQLKERVLESEQWEKMNKNEYVALVKETIDKYAIQNGLADNIKRVLIRVLSTQWGTMKEELKRQTKHKR